MKSRSKIYGFTLVELMVVITILAILVSVALPMYSKYRLENNRREATSALMSASLAQENNFITNDEYATDLSTIYPITTENGLYKLTATGVTDDGFTLTAAAQGSQQNDTDCTAITLEVDGAIERKSPRACWDTY